MARKIIIDTDPGIDDAMAILYALASPELEVIGLCSIFGNVDTSLATRNALKILEIAGQTQIPVCAGAEQPLTMPFHGGAGFVHGVDGLGDQDFPAPQNAVQAQHAVQFMIDAIEKNPGEVSIVALGPLTNLALMFLMRPDIAPKIQEIVLMGGNAFAPGNATPCAEANIWHDPEAADLVFGVDCPITMVGLDVTEKVYAQPAWLDELGRIENPRAQFLARILPIYRQFYSRRTGEPGVFLHDSTTITYLLKPGIFEFAHHPVRVETQGLSRGKTWAALSYAGRQAPWADRKAVKICVNVDAPEALRMEMACHAKASLRD